MLLILQVIVSFMVATPTASTTSLSQRVSDEFSLSQQIRETLDTTSVVSKRLDEMATDYQLLASSFRMSDLETQQMMLDSMSEFAEVMPHRSRAFQNTMKDVEPLFSKTVQKSLRPASASTVTEAGVGNTLSRQSASHEIGGSPSTTEPATTTPEVAIGEFLLNTNTAIEPIRSKVSQRTGFFVILGLSLGWACLVTDSPEEMLDVAIQISGILGGVNVMYEVSKFLFGDQ